jgi:flagellar biosynthesis protein FliR
MKRAGAVFQNRRLNFLLSSFMSVIISFICNSIQHILQNHVLNQNTKYIYLAKEVADILLDSLDIRTG